MTAAIHGQRLPARAAIEELLSAGELRAVYQPIVELETRSTIGFEALARGPRGSELESPAALFPAAAEEGLLPEFDRACRSLALKRARDAGLDPSQLLFLNVEPAGLGAGGVLDRLAEDRLGSVSVVVELTERALTARPADVLAAVDWLRQRGCRIALDDVGVDERSLALMPFLSPDVIKLDASLTQDQLPALATARVLNAVGAEAERSGALILAEGIETEEHRRRALAMGATLGQGWLFGYPDEQLDPAPAAVSVAVPRRPATTPPSNTPFEQIADARRLRRGDKRLLLALSRQLEDEAFSLDGEVVVCATFQDAGFFSHRSRRRYERLAEHAALVGALGVGIDACPGAGVRGAALDPDDALRGEWDVIVISPHFAGAFVARDLGDRGADAERRFDYFITYDRELVTAAAQRLLHRIVPGI